METPEDLPAFTDLANLIRKRAYGVMKYHSVEATGEKTLEQIAGHIAVSVLMSGEFLESVKNTLADG